MARDRILAAIVGLIEDYLAICSDREKLFWRTPVPDTVKTLWASAKGYPGGTWYVFKCRLLRTYLPGVCLVAVLFTFLAVCFSMIDALQRMLK